MNKTFARLPAVLLCCVLLMTGIAFAEPEPEPVEDPVFDVEITWNDDEASEAEEDPLIDEEVDIESEYEDAFADEAVEYESPEVVEAEAVNELIDISLNDALDAPETNDNGSDPDKILIDEDHFKDENFREYLTDTYGDSVDANAVTEISFDWRYLSVRDLSGIELFPNLTKLVCTRCYLTSLDLSHNPKLTYLDCANCSSLTSLDLSHNSKLTYLDCANCSSLTSIDLGEITSLQHIKAGSTKLTELDVSKNTGLLYLDLGCYSGQLKTLTLGQLPELKYLNCCYNEVLSSLDITGLPALEFLDCSGNSLAVLDISSNRNLQDLDCSSNYGLSALDVSGNPNLQVLSISNTAITSIDLSKNTKLALLSIDDTHIEWTLIENCPYLIRAVLEGKYQELDLFGMTMCDYTLETEDEGNYNGFYRINLGPDQKVYTKLPEPTLTKPALTIGVGEEITGLLADGPVTIGECTITYSDPGVAAINDAGILTGIAPGETTVTLTSNKFGSSADLAVNVKKAPVSVTLSAKSKVVYKGQKAFALKATLPDGSASNGMAWDSSNKTVAKVSANGEVTILKVGVTNITVKTFNGKTATCTVTVKDPKIPTKIAITCKSSSVKMGKTIKLKAKPTFPVSSLAPKKYTVTWTSSNKKIATVNKKTGKVKGIKPGKVKITVKINGFKATKKIKVTKKK